MRAPYDGDNDQQIIDRIEATPINWEHREFEKRSIGCKNFLKNMLLKNQIDRYDADTALNDDFIQDNCFDEDDRRDFKKALRNFRNYPNLGPL